MDAQKKRSAIDILSVLVYMVYNTWENKKLIGALFIDVKGAFNHVSKSQLFKHIIELSIDKDLVDWTRSYVIDQKIQIITDGHENKEREIETNIPQRSSVMSILFLLYISGVFDSFLKSCLSVISFSFVDDLRFIASGSSMKDIAFILEKMANTVLEWGKINAITYDTVKIEAIFFSRSHR